MSTYGDIERTANERTLPILAFCRQSVWKRGEDGPSSILTKYVGNEPFLSGTFAIRTGNHLHSVMPKSGGSVELYRCLDGSYGTIPSVATTSRKLHGTGFSCVYWQCLYTSRCVMVLNVSKNGSLLTDRGH